MSAAQPDIRRALYDRLNRRNRRIGVLRIAVPLAGMALLAAPVAQLGLSMLEDALPVAGLRLEADTLVIDSPRFEGRTATGTNYKMSAERAESRVGDLDIADLYGLTIDLSGSGGYTAVIGFTSAQWTMSRERLTSNEDVAVRDSTGMEGQLAGLEVDWAEQVLISDGPVHFEFGDGTRLDARTLQHDMGAATWRFTGVTLDMTPAPDAGQARDPHAGD